MKKIINKNKILLLILLFIVSFAVGYITTTNNTYMEDSPAGAIDANYDKMRISYIRIKERKTGLASWNSESDMNGNDANDTNEYLRTNDTMSYILEVGIERNEETTTVTDNFKGGKIKVKVTLPKDESGIPYLTLQREAWMKDIKKNNDLSEITAYYEIPSDKSAIGGNQQLSFTVKAGALKHVIESDYMPKFEVWMEGNQPDNEDSVIESKIIQDEGPLYVTARADASLSLYASSSNLIKMPGELNGVRGEYISFGTRIYGSSTKGREIPVNHLSSSYKIEYYYKDIEQGTGWINIATLEEDPIYGTVLYSYGRACEDTPGFYPTSSSNKGYSYCAKNSYSYISTTGTGGSYYEWDSGTLQASQDGNIVNYSNDGFYFYGNSNYTVASNGFELFVPWYEPEEGGRYQYQIKITNRDITTEDSSGTEYTKSISNSATITFYNYMDGNVSKSFSSGNTTAFTDTNIMNSSSNTSFYSNIWGSAGPFHGMDRLIAWNSTDVDIGTSSPYFSYSSLGPYNNANVDNKIYYGVLKSNPASGLLTDEEVNAAVLDDFDWYTTKAEAQSKGTITALKFSEPNFIGLGCDSYAYLYLRAKPGSEHIGKKGIIRQKVYLYENDEHTEAFMIGDLVDYTSSIINDDQSALSRQAAPQELGQTYYIGTIMSVGMSTTVGKSSYNVEEEVVNLTATPSFKDAIDDLEFSNFQVKVNVPTYLKYKVNSSNYEPTSVTENSDGTSTIIWEFNHWSLYDKLPKITYQLEISPYAPNNVSKTVSVYSYCSDLPNKYGYDADSFYIINLAGSSIRKIMEKEFVDREERIDISNYIFNIAQSRLYNVKTVEILPKNGDEIGSTFSGNYTLEVLSLIDTQKLYYTTSSVDNIGLVPDTFGKMHLPSTYNLDEHSDTWIEIHVGDIIPANATAIASYIPEVTAVTDVVYKFKFIPVGNTYEDKYFFKLTASSDTLENAIATEYKRVTVADRKLSGIVFFDNNRNNVYNAGTDTVLANKEIKVYKANGELERTLTTDENGYYESYHFDRGEYYIQYTLEQSNHSFVTKNGGSLALSSIIYPETGKSEIIQELNQVPTAPLVLAENKNVGIKYKDVQVLVHHYLVGTTTPVHDDVTINTYYTATYNTSSFASSSLYEQYAGNYAYNNTTAGDPVSGTVNKDSYEVIYYYSLKPATVKVHHYIKNTTTKVHDDDVINKLYTNDYETNYYSTEQLQGIYTNNFYYNEEHGGDPISGTVSKDLIEVIYYYEPRSSTVTVHHYLDGSTIPVHDDQTFTAYFTYQYQTSYVNPSELYEGYTDYFSHNGNTAGDPTSGTVSKDNYEIIYYYGRRPGNLTVYHVVINSGNYNGYLVDPINSTILFGDTYSTEPVDNPIYTYIRNSGDEEGGEPTSGIITKQTTRVYYYYERKTSVVTVHHYLYGTTTPVHEDQVYNKYYDETYSTSFIQTDYLDDDYKVLYEYNDVKEGDMSSGTINKDAYEITYYYDRRPCTLKVRHVLLDTGERIAPDEITTLHYGDDYVTHRVDNPNYTPAGEAGFPTSGIVANERIEVIYYYEIKPATITVHHYIEGTETKVHEDDILNRNYKDVYDTSYYDTEFLIGGYKDLYKYNNHSVGNTFGIVNSDNYEVIYYYEKIDAELIIHHFVKDTTFKVHENEKINLKLGDTYETRYKESDELIDSDYIYDSVVGEPIVVMDATRKEITYYYVLKTGNIVVHHITDDTSEELCPDETVEGAYKERYNFDSCTTLSNINYTFKEINSSDTKSVIDNDKITGRIRQDNTEITYYYTYKPGQIIVHHFLSGTRERVADDVIANGKINQEYTSSSKELEGYKLVKEPEEKTLSFKEDTQELVYEYERLKYKIEVVVLDGEGDATGSEEVFYGNNAKKNIIITPGEGYEINSVVVNGDELTSLDIDGMKLPKFENVKKDILVEVKFAKKTQVVPITGRHSSLVYISSILFVIAIALITLFEFKKSKKH